jgi:hypothetical protein
MRPAGQDHDNGHASHADHGDWLTHRRWPWTRWRQACNRRGTPGAYLVDGLVPRGRPSTSGRVPPLAVPDRGPARRAAPSLAVTPHQACSDLSRR